MIRLPLSSNAFGQTVTLQRQTDALSSQGGANPAASGLPVTIRANVQYGATRREDVADAMSGGTIPRTVTSVEVYFAGDPSVRRGDKIVDRATVIDVLGPARDTGNGVTFWLECEAVS